MESKSRSRKSYSSRSTTPMSLIQPKFARGHVRSKSRSFSPYSPRFSITPSPEHSTHSPSRMSIQSLRSNIGGQRPRSRESSNSNRKRIRNSSTPRASVSPSPQRRRTLETQSHAKTTSSNLKPAQRELLRKAEILMEGHQMVQMYLDLAVDNITTVRRNIDLLRNERDFQPNIERVAIRTDFIKEMFNFMKYEIREAENWISNQLHLVGIHQHDSKYSSSIGNTSTSQAPSNHPTGRCSCSYHASYNK